MDLRVIMIQRIPEENKMVIGIDRCLPNPENLIGQYIHFTEDPQEVLPSLKVTKAVLDHILSEWEEYSNGQILKIQRESLINTFYHRLSVEAFNEKQPGELRETKKAIRSQTEDTFSEGSETTGEVREEPVLDFSASPLNNQLERPAVKSTRREDIFIAIITWVAVLLVTCGILGGLFVFMAWLKAVSISFSY